MPLVPGKWAQKEMHSPPLSPPLHGSTQRLAFTPLCHHPGLPGVVGMPLHSPACTWMLTPIPHTPLVLPHAETSKLQLAALSRSLSFPFTALSVQVLETARNRIKRLKQGRQTHHF